MRHTTTKTYINNASCPNRPVAVDRVEFLDADTVTFFVNKGEDEFFGKLREAFIRASIPSAHVEKNEISVKCGIAFRYAKDALDAAQDLAGEVDKKFLNYVRKAQFG